MTMSLRRRRGGAFDPRRSMRFFEDFTGNTGAGETGMSAVVANSGVVTASATNVAANHPGYATISTGAVSAAGSAGVNRSNNTGVIFGGGAATFATSIQLPVLSTAGERYILRVGTGDNAGGDNTNGLYFEYDESTSANWRIVAALNTTRTKVTTSTPVAVADGVTWTALRIEVNAAGTSVSFFVDDVLIGILGDGGTATVNIPTAAPRVSHVCASIVKSVGTTARVAAIDYFWLEKLFTTRR